MAQYLPNHFKAFLATSLSAGTAATTIVLDRVTTLNGETIETADLATLGYGTVTVNPNGDGLTSFPETIKFTGITAATKTLTGVTRGLTKAGVADTDLMRFHPVGTPVIISFGVHQVDALITYLNSLVVSTRSVIVSGTAGETVAAGNLIYFDDTDNEWKLADADIAATVENTLLGIAQGAGVDGGTIATGVLLLGKDTTNSGLTAGQKYFASNTAGGLSTTAGTKEVSIGFGTVDGFLYFQPRYDQVLTEAQQDDLDTIINAAQGSIFYKGASALSVLAPGTDGQTLRMSGATAISWSSGILFGGDGSDGALTITSGTTNINLLGAQVVTKNYSSISITGTATVTFTNPHANGTIVVLKSQGNVTITTSATRAIDLRSLGGAGGAATTAGNTGITTIGDASGGNVGSSSTGGTASSGKGSSSASYTLALKGKMVHLAAGAGGAGGVTTTGAGGAGGRGGGGLYIECGGALNITGTIDVSGTAGSAGTGGAPSGGGGGGGGGGTCIILYQTLTADTSTITITGGAGGAGGVSGGGGGGGGAGGTGVAGTSSGGAGGIGASSAGGGGGGGASLFGGGNGATGSDGTGNNAGGGGGGGAAGYSLVAANKDIV